MFELPESSFGDVSKDVAERKRRQLLHLERNTHLLLSILEEGAGVVSSIDKNLRTVATVKPDQLSGEILSYKDVRASIIRMINLAVLENRFSVEITPLLRSCFSAVDNTLVRGDVDLQASNAQLLQVLALIRRTT